MDLLYYDPYLTSECTSQYGSEPSEKEECNCLAHLYLNERAAPQRNSTRFNKYLFNYITSALRNMNLDSLGTWIQSFWRII